MTEKEKMLSGELYNGMENELLKMRQKAKLLINEISKLDPLDLVKREEKLRKLIGQIGANPFIELPVYFDYGSNIKIGNNFYSNYNLTILDGNKVTIGNNVFLAPNVSIYTAGHPIDKDIRNSGLEYAKEICIGNDVWIGGNTVILPGVKIGNNVVIGAGSVVNRDIEDNCVACGNPCKVVKKI